MALRERFMLENPVLTKELRVRMRGSRAYWIMLGYLGFLSLVVLGMYAGWLNQNHSYGASSVADLGTQIYTAIYVTQIFLVLFITPAITSGALTIEREQQTSEMLRMTRLSSGSIVAGKLFSAVAFTALLLLTSLPLVSLCFTMGGIDTLMVFQSYLMLLAGSVFVGAMGLMWSSIAKTTAQAVMYTYMSMVGAALVVFLGFGCSQWSGADGDVIATVCRAVGETWFGGKVSSGLSVSSFGFTILCVLLGLIMATVAASRIEMRPERKGGLLRGLTTLAVGLQLLAVNRWWLHAYTARGDNAVSYAVSPPIGALILPAALMMILATIFCTGEFAPNEFRSIGKTIRDGWKFGQLKCGGVASGMPFLVLLTLFCLLLFAASGLFASTSPKHFIGIGLILVSAVFGFGMYCQFLSALMKNRWAAWLFATVSLFLLTVTPWIALLSRKPNGQTSPLVSLFYLNPAFLVSGISQPPLAGRPSDYFPIEFSPEISVILGTFCWMAIAALSLVGTHYVAGFSTRRATAQIKKAA